MLIYKKNCSKIIKIGILFLKTYEADAKKVVVSGKDYLRRLQLKHAYLKKTKTYYFTVLNGHNIRFFGYEFIKLRFNREIVNSNKKGI